MLGFLDTLKRLRGTRSTIVFDEDYCHSAGADSGGKIYKIANGTTEIVFVFPNYDGFMRTYLFDNPYLADEVRQSLWEKRGIFCAHVVDEAAYVCMDRVGADGRLKLSSGTLTPLNTHRKLRLFSQGAIGFGVFRPADRVFDVLWATMYETDASSPSA